MATDNIDIDDVCSKFDSYFVAEKQNQIDKRYRASSDIIFSDGKFDHHINSEGYIVIENVRDANYLIFTDQTGDVRLIIYQNTPSFKFKDIIDRCNQIRETTGEIKSEDKNDNSDIKISERLIDINTFVCPTCNGKMTLIKPKSTSETIVAYCKKCNIEYVLVPSKYYVIKAQKQFYNSTNERHTMVENIISKKGSNKNERSNKN
jgi:uncharacterized protein YbaR (Trm112 family)